MDAPARSSTSIQENFPDRLPILGSRNREILALSAAVLGICLLNIGTVGVVLGLLFGGPLATCAIIAITLTDIIKNFALTTTGKIVVLSIISLFVGGVCLRSGSSALPSANRL